VTRPVEPPHPLWTRDEERQFLASGCLLSLGSALLTCCLLFINGSLVLAVLEVFRDSFLLTLLNMSDSSEGGVVRDKGFSQFVLLAVPVILVLFEWLMIDYLRNHFFSQRSSAD
jgi:hypothetical protein